MNSIHSFIPMSNLIAVERSQIILDSGALTSGNLRNVFQETIGEQSISNKAIEHIYEKNLLETIRNFFNKCFASKKRIKKLKEPSMNISWIANPAYRAVENTCEEIENYQEIEHIYEEIENYQEIEHIYEEIENIRESSEDSAYEIPRQVEPAIYLEVLS